MYIDLFLIRFTLLIIHHKIILTARKNFMGIMNWFSGFSDNSINPASGLPMTESGCDVCGSPFGTDLLSPMEDSFGGCGMDDSSCGIDTSFDMGGGIGDF